jgi:hypothetical protein
MLDELESGAPEFVPGFIAVALLALLTLLAPDEGFIELTPGPFETSEPEGPGTEPPTGPGLYAPILAVPPLDALILLPALALPPPPLAPAPAPTPAPPAPPPAP